MGVVVAWWPTMGRYCPGDEKTKTSKLILFWSSRGQQIPGGHPLPQTPPIFGPRPHLSAPSLSENSLLLQRSTFLGRPELDVKDALAPLIGGVWGVDAPQE